LDLLQEHSAAVEDRNASLRERVREDILEDTPLLSSDKFEARRVTHLFKTAPVPYVAKAGVDVAVTLTSLTGLVNEMTAEMPLFGAMVS
jgi:hypothetical protein